MQIVETINPSNVTKLTTPTKGASATYVFDLGHNYAGVASLALPTGVAAGSTIKLTFGERWNETTQEFVGTTWGQEDSYIFSGTEKEGAVHHPAFVYHGFRFVVADYPVGMSDQKCDADTGSHCLVGHFIHTDVQQTGFLAIGAASVAARVAASVADGATTAATTKATTADTTATTGRTPVPTDPTSASLSATTSSTSTASILDKIHKAVLQGQLCNLHSIPTDCPQREKRGWMGDAQWTSEEAAMNFDMQTVYSNWVTTMADMQEVGCTKTTEQFKKEPPYGTCCSPTLDELHPTIFQCSPQSNYSDTAGSIPDIVPLLWGNGGGRGWPGAPTWAGAIVVIPDLLLSRYQDLEFSKAIYPSLQKYMGFLGRQAAAYGHGVPQFGMLGDWCAIDPLCPGSTDKCLTDPGWTSGNPTSSFYYVQHLATMEAMAAALGKSDDVKMYAAMAVTAKAAYNSAFFNTSVGHYGEEQTANVMPLALGIVPAEHLASVVKQLLDGLAKQARAVGRGSIIASSSSSQRARNVVSADVALSTGAVGARWVLQALSSAQVNRTDVALALASRSAFPSWGFMANNQPGTLWENWEYNSGSANHIMFGGGIDPWLYKEVGGIRLHSTFSTGVSSSQSSSSAPLSSVSSRVIGVGVKAEIILAVKQSSASLRVPGGRVAFHWRWEPAAHSSTASSARGAVFHVNVSVPVAYTARLVLPASVGAELLQETTNNAGHLLLPTGQHALSFGYGHTR
jgi:hypothetical protein